MDDLDKKLIAIACIVITVLGGLIGFIVDQGFAHNVWKVDGTQDIWSCDAPFGHFYVNVDGSWGLLAGSISSTPSEAYTVKYLAGNELVTVVLDATGLKTHVIFTNMTDPMAMKLAIYHRYNDGWFHPGWFGRDQSFDNYDVMYKIYLPDPKLFPSTS